MEEILRDRGALLKVEEHKMAVGKCYRCKTVVEPYLSPQWFVNITPLAKPAIEAVESGAIRIIPEGWTNNYLAWMRDIKDWCISGRFGGAIKFQPGTALTATRILLSP